MPQRSIIADVFANVYAVFTRAVTGAERQGRQSTGISVFSTSRTLLGLLSISLPLLRGVSGMPIGIQMVGTYADDAWLVRIASRLEMEAGR
jgi:Asp-tRNA(Asn)/Glu-tRNA(Gln) amidotransferase A subunit family amidase